jgi:HPt (histidine-containing phosphotransfer) domain-containing protein
MPNTDGLSKAQQVMQRLKADFLAEMPERLNNLEQIALQLHLDDTFSQVFDELYRKTHSLKGSGGTYGLPVVSAICHEMEEGFSSHASLSGKSDEQLVDRCLGYIDLMRQVTMRASQGQTMFPEIEATLSSLRAARVGQRFTALLVEPSRVNTTLYLGVLKGLPIEFSVIDTAYAALELLLHSRFDLLITGYETPLLNGAALIAAMRLCGCPNESSHAILITSNPDLPIPPPLGPDLVLPRDGRIAVNLLESVRGVVNRGKAAV